MVTAGQAILRSGGAQPTADTSLRSARLLRTERFFVGYVLDTFSGCRASVPRVARFHRLTGHAKSFKVQPGWGSQREKVLTTSGKCSLTGDISRGTGNANCNHTGRPSTFPGNEAREVLTGVSMSWSMPQAESSGKIA